MARERDWRRITIGLDLGNKEYIEIKEPWPWGLFLESPDN